MSDLDEIRGRLGDIPSLWRSLGLPGEPSRSCKSPLREDRNPSFSIYSDGQRWRDHSTGDGGDVLDFFAAAKGLPLADAIRELRGQSPSTNRTFRPPTKARERLSNPRRSITLPKMDRGSYREIQTLQRSRRLPINAGIEVLIRQGLLGFTEHQGHRAWILTDSARKCAQIRRLDGQPIETKGGTTKAKTLPGSIASWPVGVADLGDAENVVLCEGGPDLIAAVTAWFLADAPRGWGFVSMLGASQSIDREAVANLCGRRIIIAAHHDIAGWKAARQWARTLRADGITSTVWLPPKQGMDLNDIVSDDLDRAISIFTPNN